MALKWEIMVLKRTRVFPGPYNVFTQVIHIHGALINFSVSLVPIPGQALGKRKYFQEITGLFVENLKDFQLNMF